MSLAPTIKLSYEERILNMLGRIKHKRADDFMVRTKREFDAIREVLRPFYDEHKAMREALFDWKFFQDNGDGTVSVKTSRDAYQKALALVYPQGKPEPAISSLPTETKR